MPKKIAASMKKLTILVLISWAMLVSYAQAQTAANAERYVLQPNDEVIIQYRYTPEFNQTVKIQPDGYVTLEVIGEQKIGGLTLAGAQALILEKARTKLQDPEVNLALKDFQGPFFLVAGEVIHPGKFELRGHTTVLQAVLLAGGFKDEAKTSQVVVLRRLNPELVEVRTVNLGKTTKHGAQVKDFPIQSGDMVMVPQNAMTRVSRYLRATNVGLFLNPLQWIQ